MSIRFSNTTSDFLQWDEMLNLVRKLYDEKNYKMSLLISLGCFWGLRISDLLSLQWSQILSTNTLELIESKTGKKRIIRINTQLQRHIKNCHTQIRPISDNSKCFISQMGTTFSIQRINVLFKEIKARHSLRIKNFSTHSMRKTFGREVYNRSGSNAEFALIKLADLFNHSDIKVTRRYLGIKHDEMMETYDCLTF